MAIWTKICSISGDFSPTAGTVADVAEAVRGGADLRRFSTYDPESTGLVEETMSLQTTWVFDQDHVGGLSTLRHPVDCGLDFWSRPTVAYWIFNVAAPSSSAMVPLDGQAADAATGRWIRVDNTPFERALDKEWLSKQYHWWVREDWEEVCCHDQDGSPSKGSWEEVRRAANDGCELKVGIRNLWSHLASAKEDPLEHEVFTTCGTQFAHVEGGFFGALTTPTFMVRPGTPLKFRDDIVEPGWLLVRTDGRVRRQTLKASTLGWEQTWSRHAVRWFAR